MLSVELRPLRRTRSHPLFLCRLFFLRELLRVQRNF